MKVYAVIEGCSDEYYPDYTVVDDCVYLKREDAKKRMEQLIKEHRYSEYSIHEFGVKE